MSTSTSCTAPWAHRTSLASPRPPRPCMPRMTPCTDRDCESWTNSGRCPGRPRCSSNSPASKVRVNSPRSSRNGLRGPEPPHRRVRSARSRMWTCSHEPLPGVSERAICDAHPRPRPSACRRPLPAGRRAGRAGEDQRTRWRWISARPAVWRNWPTTTPSPRNRAASSRRRCGTRPQKRSRGSQRPAGCAVGPSASSAARTAAPGCRSLTEPWLRRALSGRRRARQLRHHARARPAGSVRRAGRRHRAGRGPAAAVPLAGRHRRAKVSGTRCGTATSPTTR